MLSRSCSWLSAVAKNYNMPCIVGQAQAWTKLVTKSVTLIITPRHSLQPLQAQQPAIALRQPQGLMMVSFASLEVNQKQALV